MPIGFNIPQLRRPNVATPPFMPQGSVPPALSSPEEEDDLVPSSAASRELQDLIAARQQEQVDHPTSMKRKILGGIVGGWAPQIGQAIADPGGQRFRQQAELLKQKAQLEDAALDRRYKIENIQSGIANRQELRRQAQQKLDDAAAARDTADMATRDKMGQMVVNPEHMRFESGAPSSTSLTQPPQYGPPPPPAMDSPEGPEYRSVAGLPLRSELGFAGPHKDITATMKPEGTYQVSSTTYDPKGSIRVQKTPGQIAKEKWESTTVETPQDILEAFPGSASRMTENSILGFRNALVRKDEGAAARLAAQERANEQRAFLAQQNDANRDLRRDLAGQSAGLQRELAANKGAGGGRPTTGAERQALAYFNRAKSALEDLTNPGDGAESLEDRIAKSGAIAQAGLRLPAIMQNADQQRYTQAQRAFTEARLRKESGAAIPEHEIENDAKTYFAQPGDTPEVKAQKRAARQAVLDGLAFSSGKAYEEFFGEPLQTPAAKARGASPTSPAAPAGTKKYQQTRKGTDGKNYGWSPGMANWEVIQ